MSNIDKVLLSVKYALDNLRISIPALSCLNDVEFLLFCYLVTWGLVKLTARLMKNSVSQQTTSNKKLVNPSLSYVKAKEEKELEWSKLQKEVHTLIQEVNSKQETIDKLSNQVAKLECSISSSNLPTDQILDDLFDARVKLERQDIALEKFSDTLQIKNFRIGRLESENEELKNAIEKHKEQFKDLHQKYTNTLQEYESQKDQDEKAPTNEKISQLNNTIRILYAELESKSEKLDKRETESFDLCEQLNAHSEMLDEKVITVDASETKNGHLKETVRILKAEVEKQRSLNNQNDQKINELEDGIDRVEKLNDALKNQWALDGRNYSAKIKSLEETIEKLRLSNSDVNLPSVIQDDSNTVKKMIPDECSVA